MLTKDKTRSGVGVWSLVAGILTAFGVAMIGQATFGWIPGFDPAGWLRIVTAWLLPIGALAAVLLGTLSIRRKIGRPFGIAGLALAILAVAAFVAMIASYDY